MNIIIILIVAFLIIGCQSSDKKLHEQDPIYDNPLLNNTKALEQDTIRDKPHKIKTKIQEQDPILARYPYIVKVYSGFFKWDEATEADIMYRLMVNASEIYETVFVEQIIMKSEGIMELGTSFKVTQKTFNRISNVIVPFRKFEVREWLEWNVVKVQIESDCGIMTLAQTEAELKLEGCTE